MKTTPICFLLALALCSCRKENAGSTVVRRDGNPDYVRVTGDSTAAMDAAIARSRAEIGVFIKALKAPKPSQTYFSVKKPCPWQDGDTTSHEHIWLSDVTYQDGKFSGKLANEPVDVKDLKIGDTVSVDEKEASDWMIIDDNRLVGGYTIIALRDQMPEAEKREFDASVPFEISPP
jgi:uncharacterized protein YegJ (DUF2314 family)